MLQDSYRGGPLYNFYISVLILSAHWTSVREVAVVREGGWARGSV